MMLRALTPKSLLLRATVLLLVCAASLALPAQAKSKRASLIQRIHVLIERKLEKKKQASEARRKLRALKRKEHTIASQVQETQRDLEGARNRYHSVSRRLDHTRTSLAQTQRDLLAVQSRLEKHNAALGTRLVSIYKNGDFTYLEMLLDSDSFSDVVKRTYLFRKIVENDVALLHSIKEEKEAAVHKRNTLERQKHQVERLQVEVGQHKQEIASQAEKEHQLLFKVRHERAAYEEYVHELEQSSNEITELIRRLSSRPSGGVRVIPWKGGFARPVAGRVTSSFGWRMHPIFHVRRFHTGVDLSVPYGTTVHAAAGGRCIFAGWKPAYGKTLVIDHGGGLATVYGHCSALLLSEGARVRQGQPVARVGSTGISTGPHLHFEVRRNGSPVNPLTFH